MYYIAIIILVLFLWFIYRRQLQNLVRPLKYQAEFSGSPHYVAGITNGSPLSELGSHCGFKTVPEKKAAACNALFATVTSLGAGRLCDFAVCLYGEGGQVFFRSPQQRKVYFRPYCIEEHSAEQDLQLYTKLYFLRHNVAVLDLEWEGSCAERLRPAFKLLPVGGRDLENPYPHFNGLAVVRKRDHGLLFSSIHRVPGLRLHAYFLPAGGSSNGRKELLGPLVTMQDGGKKRWSVLISFSAENPARAIAQSQQCYSAMEVLSAEAKQRWNTFEKGLPVTGDKDDRQASKAFNLAAWALYNNLYAPRGSMERMGSVPAKVYFPFIWGWDTPQHVLGLSELDPQVAADVLLTQLTGNRQTAAGTGLKLKAKGITLFAGRAKNQIPSKLDDSLKGVLNLYSQPPLQSWAALRTYLRIPDASGRKSFLQKALPPLKENIQWWEENRKLPNGFFSYLNGLESGLDDSPRFYPRSFLPSFIVGLIPRFLSAVDLNCWIYQSYMNYAWLSRETQQENDADYCLKRAAELREIIDQKLWSAADGAWLDRRNGSFARIFTPVIWWPAFLGASADLGKIHTVIQNHLLNPAKFWGNHGIPSVAFDDKTYNQRKDGYYWRGQIWMINNYAALEVLFRFGYAEEAAELHRRVVQTMYKAQGHYETYNADTGQIGWSSRGPGDPAVMQFGMSAAWATQILLYRYQHFCYIFPHTKELCGHIQWATTFNDMPLPAPPGAGAVSEEAVLQVVVPGSSVFDIPRLLLKSNDGKPLLESANLKVRFDSTARSVTAAGKVILYWKNESYRLRPGVEYVLKPQSSSEKLMRAWS